MSHEPLADCIRRQTVLELTQAQHGDQLREVTAIMELAAVAVVRGVFGIAAAAATLAWHLYAAGTGL